jgi:hypothetical protein
MALCVAETWTLRKEITNTLKVLNCGAGKKSLLMTYIKPKIVA